MKILSISIEKSTVDALLKLAVPIIIGNVLQTMYQLTDTYWVGRLGNEATAAVSLSFPVMFLLISLGAGLPMAGTILVAQFKGKGDQRAVNHIVTQTFLMLFLISILISIVGYLITPAVMRASGASSEVLPLAISYLRITFIGIISVFTYFVFESLMRGVGEGNIPTYIVLSTVLLNLILDPLFIYGYGPIPGYGVTGAAIATIITQTIASATGLYIMFKGKYGIHMEKKIPSFDFPLIKKMFFLGLPSSIEQSAVASALIVMTFLVASFGTEILAANGIGGRVFSFIIIPAFGLSIATAALVGQNLGAGNKKHAGEIAETSAFLGFVSLTLIGIVMFFLAPQIARFFLPNVGLAQAESVNAIKWMSITFGFMGIQQVISGVFRGAGNTRTSMLISIGVLWLVYLPSAFVLSKFTAMNVQGLWASMPIANVVGSIIVIYLFKKDTWKDKELTQEFKMEEKTTETILAEEIGTI